MFSPVPGSLAVLSRVVSKALWGVCLKGHPRRARIAEAALASVACSWQGGGVIERLAPTRARAGIAGGCGV